MTRLTALALLGLLHSAVALGAPGVLEDRVHALIARHLPPRSQLQAIDLGQPGARIASCESPLPSLVHPEQSAYGRVAVQVECEGEEGLAGYLQVSVSAIGEYVTTTRKISSGDVITATMLQIKRGPLEHLAKGAVLKPEQVLGRQASRSYKEGSILVLNNFQERWLVLRNQNVVLQAQGPGFTIRRDGKALDNGALGSSVRVLGSDGKMLTAQVVGQNELLLRF
jgi:flagella basal body P-ring formation protein FlgA